MSYPAAHTESNAVEEFSQMMLLQCSHFAAISPSKDFPLFNVFDDFINSSNVTGEPNHPADLTPLGSQSNVI